MSARKEILNQTYIRMWWFPGVVGVIVFLGTILVLIPQLQQVRQTLRELSDAKSTVIKAQSKLDQAEQLDSQEIDSQLRLTRLALPEHKPYYEVLQAIQSLSSSIGVQAGDFDLTPGSLATKSAQIKTDSSGYVTLSTKLAITGQSDRVIQFVEQLQLSLPLVSVTSISISPETKGEDMNRRQANLDILIHYALPRERKTEISVEPVVKLSDADKATLSLLSTYSGAKEVAASSSAAVSNYGRTDVFSF